MSTYITIPTQAAFAMTPARSRDAVHVATQVSVAAASARPAAWGFSANPPGRSG
ncbi:MAG: hypothetical protein IPH03_05755 [Tetrasphaera sp.]|nr:hypothetical protein [Tetrasphaera sp.]